MKRDKGLWRENSDGTVSAALWVTLEKSELAILEKIADARGFRAPRSGQPGIAESVTFLVRVGINCFRDHTEKYQSAKRISHRALREAELHITKDPNRGAGRIKTLTVSRHMKQAPYYDD